MKCSNGLYSLPLFCYFLSSYQSKSDSLKPPRKGPARGKAGGASRPGSSKDASASTTKSARRSKLAKENDITAEEEIEIKEAWNLFRVPDDDIDLDEEYRDEKEGVIRTSDVRNALK